jgi:hypothetical protein
MTEAQEGLVYDVAKIIETRIRDLVATQVRAYNLNAQQEHMLRTLLNAQFNFKK